MPNKSAAMHIISVATMGMERLAACEGTVAGTSDSVCETKELKAKSDVDG